MADWYSNPNNGLKVDWSKQNLKDLLRKLITANHILHNHRTVDAYGHVSIRHPQQPDTYLLSGYMAPALVSSPSDIIQYRVDGSDPVDPNAAKGYAERFIHGEIFKMYPDVNCVIHSHAEEVLPYVTTSVKLTPAFHMAGFLGLDVPLWDIADAYQTNDTQDMLVRNARIGQALAEKFRHSSTVDTTDQHALSTMPDYIVVLMRRHGFTTWGQSIETAVYRALYTQTNAAVQTQSLVVQSAANITAQTLTNSEANFEPMSQEMAADCATMNEGTQDKPWALWEREVQVNPLYINNG